ncbi:MAG: hypothetical protein GY928_34245 [Colwellia sp.]|nr:hypothetical protein [Colwellia sp.]
MIDNKTGRRIDCLAEVNTDTIHVWVDDIQYCADTVLSVAGVYEVDENTGIPTMMVAYVDKRYDIAAVAKNIEERVKENAKT